MIAIRKPLDQINEKCVNHGSAPIVADQLTAGEPVVVSDKEDIHPAVATTA